MHICDSAPCTLVALVAENETSGALVEMKYLCKEFWKVWTKCFTFFLFLSSEGSHCWLTNVCLRSKSAISRFWRRVISFGVSGAVWGSWVQHLALRESPLSWWIDFWVTLSSWVYAYPWESKIAQIRARAFLRYMNNQPCRLVLSLTWIHISVLFWNLPFPIHHKCCWTPLPCLPPPWGPFPPSSVWIITLLLPHPSPTIAIQTALPMTTEVHFSVLVSTLRLSSGTPSCCQTLRLGILKTFHHLAHT